MARCRAVARTDERRKVYALRNPNRAVLRRALTAGGCVSERRGRAPQGQFPVSRGSSDAVLWAGVASDRRCENRTDRAGGGARREKQRVTYHARRDETQYYTCQWVGFLLRVSPAGSSHSRLSSPAPLRPVRSWASPRATSYARFPPRHPIPCGSRRKSRPQPRTRPGSRPS